MKVNIGKGASCHVGYISCFNRSIPLGKIKDSKKIKIKLEESRTLPVNKDLVAVLTGMYKKSFLKLAEIYILDEMNDAGAREKGFYSDLLDLFYKEFPEIKELATARVPRLLKPAPLLVVFAPETVTPEIERLPPEAILKILKLRLVLPLLPLMISEEAPSPVMASEPAVPLPTTVLALTMVGSADPRVIVFTPVKLKTITSLPGLLLARVMASLKEVTLSVELTVSAVVVT